MFFLFHRCIRKPAAQRRCRSSQTAYKDKNSYPRPCRNALLDAEAVSREIPTELVYGPPAGKRTAGLPEVSGGEQIWIMEHIYDHFQAFKPISCCSERPPYARCIDMLIRIRVNVSMKLISKMKEISVDILPNRRKARIISSALFSEKLKSYAVIYPEKMLMCYKAIYESLDRLSTIPKTVSTVTFS